MLLNSHAPSWPEIWLERWQHKSELIWIMTEISIRLPKTESVRRKQAMRTQENL